MTKPNKEFFEDVMVFHKEELKKPQKYAIFIHNDDYTTQEFVVHILKNFFYKNEYDAVNLMLKVHLEGKAQVGIFDKDIALSKMAQVIPYCRNNDMPLLLTMQPV